MFELEIMIAGYTAVVATTSVAISKFFNRKKINKLNIKLSKLESALKTARDEVDSLKSE